MLILLKLRYALKWMVVCFIINLSLAGIASANSDVTQFPQELSGQWYQAPDDWSYANQPDLFNMHLTPVSGTKNTGGHFFFQSNFLVTTPDILVVDFKNSSVIGIFHHYVFDEKGRLVAKLDGGIQSSVINQFMIRHGRMLKLPPGEYRLVTEIFSPFFIASPQPYLNTLDDYRLSVKYGDALTLFSLGIMFSLAVYYLTLSLVRRQISDIGYSIFITMNLIFNSMSLLVMPDMLNIHWFYFASFPILISNIAYIVFVAYLLGINSQSYPTLHKILRYLLATLCLLLVLAFVLPHWSLEFARYGVGIILLYGLSAGIRSAYLGNRIAYMYLVAVIAFFMIGSFTILNTKLSGIYTIYIEHFGLVSVTVEMLLLALVLSRQFAQLHADKEIALDMLKNSLKIAHTDALTGLPNRYPLDQALDEMSPPALLVFIDMNGLKFYNDQYGHQSGDKLLRKFADIMQSELEGDGSLYRIGGDEFAITYPNGNVQELTDKLTGAISKLRQQGFESAGMSHGIAYLSESPDKNVLKHLADTRMYEHKRLSKKTGQSTFEDTSKL